MQNISISTIVENVVTLLSEAYEGMPENNPTWFIDNGPDSGILAALRGVTAQEASTTVDGSAGNMGATIASHAEHLRWSLALVNRTLRGEPYQAHWSESWNLVEADSARWDTLRGDLQREYEMLRDSLKVMFESAGSPMELDADTLTGMLAMPPHAAYHYGVILQMMERVRG